MGFFFFDNQRNDATFRAGLLFLFASFFLFVKNEKITCVPLFVCYCVDMKITFSDYLEHESISAAIEAKAQESDAIASGIIGPSFACSGPGSGWQKNFDVADYAERALASDYGATSYIDSSDGTMAELAGIQEINGCQGIDEGDTVLIIRELRGEEGWIIWIMERQEKGGDENPEEIDYFDTYREALATLEEMRPVLWTTESMVEIELPSVEEAVSQLYESKRFAESARTYSNDESEIDEFLENLAEPYELTDGLTTEYFSSLEEAASAAEEWYDYLVDDGKIDSVPFYDLDSSDIHELNLTIRIWEEKIAEAMGHKPVAGHGNYYVSPASEAGFSLQVRIRE